MWWGSCEFAVMKEEASMVALSGPDFFMRHEAPVLCPGGRGYGAEVLHYVLNTRTAAVDLDAESESESGSERPGILLLE